MKTSKTRKRRCTHIHTHTHTHAHVLYKNVIYIICACPVPPPPPPYSAVPLRCPHINRPLVTPMDLGALPCGINISRLDDSCSIAETLAMHSAKWHKNCYLQCSSSRVSRAELRARKRSADRKLDEETYSLVKKRLRTSFASPSVEQSNVNTCFFCDKVISNDQMVHRAATKNLDSKVRVMAT